MIDPSWAGPEEVTEGGSMTGKPWWWYPSYALVPFVWGWVIWDETRGRQ